MRQLVSRINRVWKRESDGFLLPVVIALGVAISSVSVLALQGVAQNSVTTNNNYYDTLAHEAAIAGKAMANSCIANNQLPVRNALQPLQVDTDCGGLVNLGKPNYVAKGDNYISYFKVAPFYKPSDGTIVITSVGYVDFLRANGTVEKSQAFKNSVKTMKRSTPVGNISKDVDSLSMGNNHTCVAAEGQAYCWGYNANGQLGTWNNNNNSNLPVEVDVNAVPTIAIQCPGFDVFGTRVCTAPGTPAHGISPLSGKYVTKVAAGNDHSCALTSEGKVYCWGHNNFGQLGDRTNNDTNVPVAVDTQAIDIPGVPERSCGFLCTIPGVAAKPKSAIAGKKVIDIQAGDSYTCALADDGSMGCWGDNGVGQLGDTTRTNRNYPVAPYSSDAKAAVAGICAIDFFGTCLNYGTNPPVPAKPVTPLFNKKVIKLGKMGNNKHTCVITQDNIPVCWGRNHVGQVGNDVSHDTDRVSASRHCPAPPDITYDNDALEPNSVYLGGQTSTTTPQFFGLWSTTSTRPASALQGKTITDIAESSTYTTARDTNGNLYWWGGNTYTERTCRVNSDPQPNGVNDTYQSGHAERYYNINSRPVGPMYSGPRTCYFALWNFPCGDVSNVQGKSFGLYSGNSNDAVFCGQTIGTDIYCQAPTAQSFTAYSATQCDVLGSYWGQLGTGSGAGLPSIGNSCWTTNPVKVKSTGCMNGSVPTKCWLEEKTITDMHTAYATTPAIGLPFGNYRFNAYTCVLASKQVACWGPNPQGQLGTGDNNARNEPTPVSVDSPLGKPGGGGGNYSDNTDF